MGKENNNSNDAYGLLDGLGSGVGDIINSSIDWARSRVDQATANEMPVPQGEVDSNANLVGQGRTEEAAAGIPVSAVPSNLSPEDKVAWRQKEVTRRSQMPATQKPVNEVDMYAQRDQAPKPLPDQRVIPQVPGALPQGKVPPTGGGALPTGQAGSGSLPVVTPGEQAVRDDKRVAILSEELATEEQLLAAATTEEEKALHIRNIQNLKTELGGRTASAPQTGQPGAEEGGLPASPEQQEIKDKDKEAAEFAKTVPNYPGADLSGDMLMDKINSVGKMFEERMSKVQKVEYNKLSEEQHRMVALRFFLTLMEEGGKQGSMGLLGNLGIAGREALDAKRIISEQNNKNEESRFNRETKQVYDKANLELSSFKHIADQTKWKARLERIRSGKEAVGTNDKGEMVVIDAVTRVARLVKDEKGNTVMSAKAVGKGSDGESAKIKDMKYLAENPDQKALFKELYGAKGTEEKDGSMTYTQASKEAREMMKEANAPNEDGEPPAKLMTFEQALEKIKRGAEKYKSPIARGRIEKLPAEGKEEANDIMNKLAKKKEELGPDNMPSLIRKEVENARGRMEALFKKYNIN